MVVASACVFAVAHRIHSAWLMAKVLRLVELRATPARVRSERDRGRPSTIKVLCDSPFAGFERQRFPQGGDGLQFRVFADAVGIDDPLRQLQCDEFSHVAQA